MGVMDRISRLLRANVNEMLDRAEDPEIMIDQILRDMQSNIVEAKQQVAAMIAQEKEIEFDQIDTTKLAGAWGDKARRAVEAGKDDLAREALRREQDYRENSDLYAEQLALQQQAVTKLKGQLSQLEAKYQSTLSQRDVLVARQKRARAQASVAQALGSDYSPMDPSSDLDRMERKIRGEEARSAALLELEDTSLDAQFAELDYDTQVEEKLAALKASVGSTESIPASVDTPAS